MYLYYFLKNRNIQTRSHLLYFAQIGRTQHPYAILETLYTEVFFTKTDSNVQGLCYMRRSLKQINKYSRTSLATLFIELCQYSLVERSYQCLSIKQYKRKIARAATGIALNAAAVSRPVCVPVSAISFLYCSTDQKQKPPAAKMIIEPIQVIGFRGIRSPN